MSGDSGTVRAAYASAQLNNALAVVWTGDPSVVEVQRLFQELQVLWNKQEAGVYLLNVITVQTGMPSAPARDALRNYFEQARGKLRACAIVLEKSDIEGALSRTILTTLVTLARRPFVTKIFADRRSAALWLVTQGADYPAGGLAETLQRLDAQLRRASS
jgi:hypothetical protein